jgi:hypothetical protein
MGDKTAVLKPPGPQAAFLNPPGKYRDLQEALEKLLVDHAALELLFHTTQEGLGEIYENSKAFCKR